MKHLTLPILVGLALAGCTSSDQGAIGSAAPVTENFAPSSATISGDKPAPAFAGAAPVSSDMNTVADQASTVTTVTQPAASTVGFPPPPAACGNGPDQSGCARPARIETCRTVGSVTTCDVPADPMADSTHYTN